MDADIKTELMDSFNDIYEDVEDCLVQLEKKHEPEELNKMFRAIHNAKGNAGIMQLENIVRFTHSLEEVAGALRAGKFKISPEICEIIHISMDRLRDLHQRDIYNKQIEGIREFEISTLLQALSSCEDANIQSKVDGVLSFLGSGVSSTATIIQLEKPEVASPENRSVTIVLDDEKLNSDLVFFQELALQIDAQNQYWQGRSIQLFDWAMKVNKVGGDIVEYEQFAAAIYLHDIGMSFIPQSIMEKTEPYTDDEWQFVYQHPRWGYEFLNRIPGWQVAARIVLDHHEHVDGSGYPNGKKGKEIHAGAKILAIIDAFFSITRGRADRDRRKSVVRAISELNSYVDTQFDGVWIQCFNHMIRKELESGYL